MDSENKMYYKPQFKCGICGTIYNTVADRVKCESACLKKQEEEAKRVAEEKKAVEKNTRKAEIEKMYKDLKAKIDNYVNDYGSLQLDDVFVSNNDNFYGLSKLLGWWL